MRYACIARAQICVRRGQTVGGILAACSTIRIVLLKRLTRSNTSSPSPNTVAPRYAFLGLCEYETGRYDDALAHFRAWAAAGWQAPRNFGMCGLPFRTLTDAEGQIHRVPYLLPGMTPRLGDDPEIAEAMGLASLRMTDYCPRTTLPNCASGYGWPGKPLCMRAIPGKFARADEFAARLEARYPDQSEVHYLRGTIYTFQGKTMEAEREYREELKIFPNHVSSLVALAGIDLEKADLAEAVSWRAVAVDADSDNAEAHHLLGRVFLEMAIWMQA